MASGSRLCDERGESKAYLDLREPRQRRVSVCRTGRYRNGGQGHFEGAGVPAVERQVYAACRASPALFDRGLHITLHSLGDGIRRVPLLKETRGGSRGGSTPAAGSG